MYVHGVRASDHGKRTRTKTPGSGGAELALSTERGADARKKERKERWRDENGTTKTPRALSAPKDVCNDEGTGHAKCKEAQHGVMRCIVICLFQLLSMHS